jgi:hypothetical protein
LSYSQKKITLFSKITRECSKAILYCTNNNFGLDPLFISNLVKEFVKYHRQRKRKVFAKIKQHYTCMQV